MCCVVQIINAHDLIVLKSGDIISANVLEISQNEIKYKKSSNLTGPTYTIDKFTVFSIQYENGEKDLFDDVESRNSQSNFATQNSINVASNNSTLLNEFNVKYNGSNKLNSNKKSKKTFYSWAISDNSILSTDEIEIYFEGEIDRSDIGNYSDGGIYKNWQYGDAPLEDNGTYQIRIRNKTSIPIYIDLGNTFRVDNGNPTYYYLGDEQKTINNGKTSGLSIGLGAVSNVLGIGGVAGSLLGGMGINGSSSSDLTTTYIEQRILTIPPYSSTLLSKPKWIKVGLGGKYFGSGHFENVKGHYETSARFEKTINEPQMQGEKMIFEKDSSPYLRDYYITYSTEPSFSSFSIVPIRLYVNMFLGTNGKDNGIDNFDTNSIAGFIFYK